jgi:hypothetical protein
VTPSIPFFTVYSTGVTANTNIKVYDQPKFCIGLVCW